MEHAQPTTSTTSRPLRSWPGVALVIIQWLAMLALPMVFPGTGMIGILAGVAAGLVTAAWWLFFSRAAWLERLGATVLMVACVYGTSRFVHPSIGTAMMGMLLPIYAIPVISLALAAWAVAAGRLPVGLRRLSLAGVIVVGCSVFALLRTGGVTGEGMSQFHWRWTPTPEERLLARPGDEPLASPPARVAQEPPVEGAGARSSAGPAPGLQASVAAPAQGDRAAVSTGSEVTPVASPPAVAAAAAEWPGFRGPDRDGIVRGVRIDTDWSRVPPTLLWRRPVGPGWSSFAVAGDLLYTQEQRGDEEIVACYRVSTGQPVWRHRDAVRFYESNGGAGPRATPTLDRGRVYSLGATGILNALDAGSGSVVWSRNVAPDSATKVPMWGFAASPLVSDDLVVVAAAGRLAAYEARSGQPRWLGPAHGGSYSSPHRVTVRGVPQVLLMSDEGATSVSPVDGTVLWEHAWPGAAILQPALTESGDVLVSTAGNAGGEGIRRLSASRGESAWTADARWTSRGLKPYFNDFVVHNGHAYGIDGGILACIDLEDGKRVWKGGRVGFGQLVLLRDQNLLLVLSEDGELALVGATPDAFREVARVGALSAKTWNHPALVGDILLVRNGEEMAAFRLARAQK
jgi:outer membrane protein assembly factor BamB